MKMRILNFIIIISLMFTGAVYPCDGVSGSLRVRLMGNEAKEIERVKNELTGEQKLNPHILAGEIGGIFGSTLKSEVARIFEEKLNLDVNGKIICDIGSGIGDFCFSAKELYPGSTVVGIEKSPGLAKISAKKKIEDGYDNTHFINLDAINPEVDYSSFDIIYISNPLTLDRAFYEKLRDKLAKEMKPGAVLIWSGLAPDEHAEIVRTGDNKEDYYQYPRRSIPDSFKEGFDFSYFYMSSRFSIVKVYTKKSSEEDKKTVASGRLDEWLEKVKQFNPERKSEDTPNLSSLNAYDFETHEDMRKYLEHATQIQIYGKHIKGIKFEEKYTRILEDVVKGLPSDIKIILVEHNRGSPDSAERRLLFYDEATYRWIFSHAGIRKNTGKFIYLPKTAFLELADYKSGRKFLAKDIFDEIKHAEAKSKGYWSEDYHKYKDKGLRRFVVDYLGYRLYPKRIRQIVHKIDSIEASIADLVSVIADIDRAINKIKNISSENKNSREALLLLENLELKLKGSKRDEKKEALGLIVAVKEDLKSGKNYKLLSRLITSRANLNRYLTELYRQINALEAKLKKQIDSIKGKTIEKREGVSKEFLAEVSREFEEWDNAEGRDLGSYDKVIKFQSIWFSKGERAPPPISFVSNTIDDAKIKELVEYVRLKTKDFDSLSEYVEYRKWKVIDTAIKEDKLKKEDADLLRALTFIPRFYWRTKVPVEARDYICMLARRGRFGVDILRTKSVIEIDYKGDSSHNDWFLDVDLDSLSRDDMNRARYLSNLPARDLFRILSDLSGESIEHFRKIWKQGKKGQAQLYAQYATYQKTKILQNHVWGREKQIYSLKWKGVSGEERIETWKLVKDALRNRPISFARGEERLKELHIMQISI